jgi:inosine-uridine nucleoside N-ribohydrolase
MIAIMLWSQVLKGMSIEARFRAGLRSMSVAGIALWLGCCCCAAQVNAAVRSAGATPQPVIIDTDIGDDIDDVLAVGLALSSPELKIVGITSAWGNTELRARLLDRLLSETGRTDIPVAVGIEKHNKGEGVFSQARWAQRQPAREHPKAVDLLLEQIKQRPGELTLISLGPMTNLAAAIDRDPATFKQLKRIVMMAGSVRRGYDDLGYLPVRGPQPEYNVWMDIDAAKKVFTSGVPLYVMPLDSTQLKLDETKRELLFTQSTPLTDALTLLYQQWSRQTRSATPTMFDAVAVAYAVDPSLCPAEPLRLRVDDQGYTREEPGAPNTFVCLRSDSDNFFGFYMPRLLQQKLHGAGTLAP